MKIRMDKAGRVRLPKALRQRFGMCGGREIEAIVFEGGILLRHREQQATMVNVGGIWVHQGKLGSGLNWDHVIDDVREERIRHAFRA